MLATVALLVACAAPVPAGSNPLDPGQFLLVREDSAHTLFTPDAPDAGRPGQVYQLPGGGLGVTTGGTSHYQTMITPGGSGIAFPNGNNTFEEVGPGGHAGIAIPQ